MAALLTHRWNKKEALHVPKLKLYRVGIACNADHIAIQLCVARRTLSKLH